MPINNKYELRSNDVQEVMSKPPHTLISSGSTIIFLVIIVGVWILSLIKLPETIAVPFQIVPMEKISSTYTSTNQLAFIISTEFPIEIKAHQPISLILESYPVNKYGIIKNEIDTIINIQSLKVIVIKNTEDNIRTTNNSLIMLKPYMLGNAKITVGETDILKMILNRLNIFS